jgi:hypothetical protein
MVFLTFWIKYEKSCGYLFIIIDIKLRLLEKNSVVELYLSEASMLSTMKFSSPLLWKPMRIFTVPPAGRSIYEHVNTLWNVIILSIVLKNAYLMYSLSTVIRCVHGWVGKIDWNMHPFNAIVKHIHTWKVHTVQCTKKCIRPIQLSITAKCIKRCNSLIDSTIKQFTEWSMSNILIDTPFQDHSIISAYLSH